MADIRELAARIKADEQALLDRYEDIVAAAGGATEQELAKQIVRAQRFQLSTLELIEQDRVPEKFHCFGSISHEDVNMRTGPSPREDRLASLQRDDRVIVMEFQGNWARIQTGDGRQGWIFKDYVRCEG